MQKLAQYRAWFEEISKRLWFKIAISVWAIICVYDTVLSQLIPDFIAKKLPKTWQVAIMTGDLLPWWGWLLVLALIVIVALVEQLVRLTKQHNLISAANLAEDAVSSTFDVSKWVNHETYYIWVAACLWVNIKPTTTINENSPAYPALQKIKGAIEGGQISSLTGASNANAKVPRSELIKLASIHNERPIFLFAEDRDKAEFDAAFEWFALSREDAIKLLWRLRKEGVAIRNEPIPSEKLFSQWKVKYEKWRNDVLLAAEKVDENLRARLEVLDQLRSPPALPVINQEHAQCIAIASEILLRLNERLP